MKYPKIRDFRDFIDKADEIRNNYGGIFSEKFSYQYINGWRIYIYSRTNISMKLRNFMWEYLNYDIQKIDLISIYLSTKKK